jgi:phenylphosphate carboxylase alpha subunit
MDLRSYLATMIEEGMVTKIDDLVDWNLEAGAIMRYANENRGPAQWFTNIKDSMKGTSLLGGLFAAYDRVAMILGLPPDSSYHDLVDFYERSVVKRIKPKIVPSGVCQQNVMLDDDIDLFKFPVPQLHPQDGGRYIGTLNIGLCKDLDSDWVNWGTYRGMVHDRRTTGLWLGPLNQGGMIFSRYRERGKVMEYAQFYGGDPLYNIVAASGIPYGVPEVEIVGGIRNHPVELVKCKTVDLYVPADSEIVLEGTVDPYETKDEGPFGEYPGYVVAGVVKRPIFRLSAITYRDNPILPSTCLGVPLDDGLVWGLSVAANVKALLRERGIPFKQVCVPAEAAWHAVIVSTSTPYAGIAQMIASLVWTERNGSYFPYVIVVNDDIDPANLMDVFHAVCTKCNPVTGVHIYPGHVNSPLAPYLARTPFKELGYGGGNILFDCTWPVTWSKTELPHRLAFENTYPDEIKRNVLANAQRWGLVRERG